LKISRLLPAGVFYVSLKSGGGSAGTRDDERVDREQARRAGYQHRGRFDGDRLSQFDQRGLPKGDQFKYWKKNDGTFRQLGNEALPGQEFQELLAQIKDYLKQFGRGIYAGQVEVAPYRWKQETACDLCAYRPVCRFDPWTQPYRVLRPPPKADKSADHKMRPHIRPRS
jgi:ATP-dependent helicase/nuclease subunit B